MDKDIILDISLDEPERQEIKIGNEVYEFAVVDDFSPGEFLWITDAGRKIGRLFDAEYSDVGAEQLKDLLDKTVTKIVPDLPADVLAKVPAAKKFKIVMVFSDAVEPELAGTAQRSQTSSRRSNGSTAARQTIGSAPKSE